MERFSDHFEQSDASPIKYIGEAPDALRAFVSRLLLDSLAKSSLSTIGELDNFVCVNTYTNPERNWGHEYILREIHRTILDAKWQYVYDLIECFFHRIKTQEDRCSYIEEVNRFFNHSGGGWMLNDEGQIIRRGDAAFDYFTQEANQNVGDYSTSVETEIKEAIADISKRPDPDITGAIQHSMAGLECLCRKIGCSKSTLGDLLQKHKGVIPSPLNDAVIKMWGYASENGRHIVDEKESGYKEAELVVSVSCALINYLSDERFKQMEDLPF